MAPPNNDARRRSSSTPPGADDSFASTTSTSILISDAPTPNNTLLSPEAYASFSALGQDDSFSEEGIHFPNEGDVSLRPSITPSSTFHESSSRRPSSASSLGSSHFHPRIEEKSIGTGSVPHSTLPIPPPPVGVRSPKSDLPRSSFDTGGLEIAREPTIGVKLVPVISDVEATATTSSGERTQEEVDAQRLRQLGYDAVLGRDYTFWSSLSITWLNIGCLQGTIYAVSGAYSYGGPGVVLVAWPLSGILCLCLTLTMSELASAYPVSGAMASWAWKSARGGVGGERGWGWLMGGVVLGGHIGNVLFELWETCDIIAGTMELSSQYQRKSWHLVLFYLAVLLLCGTVISTASGRSHRFWLASGVYGVAIWFVLCVILLATGATHSGFSSIVGRFYNDSGWTSKSYVYFLGWQYTSIASGVDASAHLAEETQNPSRNVPNAMTASIISSYLLGYISIVLLLVSIDPKNVGAIADQSFPVGYILEQAISRPGAISLLCLIIVVLVLQVMAQILASSRFVFALARDDALPFSEKIRRTNATKQPIIATWLVISLCAPFALLLVGDESTLYSVLVVTGGSLSYVGYVVPVTLYILSGKDLQTEGRTSWSLRRWSKPIGVVGVLFGLIVVIGQALPGTKPVTAGNISWSPVVIVGTCLISFLTWKTYGDKHYSGPIRALTKWETGVEIDLQKTLARSRNDGSGGKTSGLGEETSRPDDPLGPTAEDSGSVEQTTGPVDPEIVSDSEAKRSPKHVGTPSFTEVVLSVDSAGTADGSELGSSGMGTEASDSTITRGTASRGGDPIQVRRSEVRGEALGHTK